MERKIIIKNGENYELDNLVIKEDEFQATKYYIDNLPCMYNYLDGGKLYNSFEDCVKKLNFDYKKDQCDLSIFLNGILDNDNPLIVSSFFKKLVNYNPGIGIEQCMHEGLLEHFSLRRDPNNLSVDIDEYKVINEDGSFEELIPVTEEEVKTFGDYLASFSARK